MKQEFPRPLMGVMFEKLAPKIGARVVMEPEWNIVGQITFKNGKKRYFRYSALDVNPLGAALLAKDKAYANFFMNRMGYPVIEGKTFYSPSWAKAIGSDQDIHAAYAYAKKLGWPVIVKPNNGQQGKGVASVHTKLEFYRAMREIFNTDSVALVQRQIKGRDYRIVVLDGKVVAAYERIPLSVIGDGKTSIEKLLVKKQKEFRGSSRDIRIESKDPRTVAKLKRAGMTLESVPEKGSQVFLLDNANMSSGGEAVDVTNTIHSYFTEMAVKLTADMGLFFCGVDIMVEGGITKSNACMVLEVNSSPGLDHYAKSGKAQYLAVEGIYLQALRLLDKLT